MDDTPDYQCYSLKDLYDVAGHIDKKQYPDRYALVLAQIEHRKRMRRENPSAFQEPTEARGGCMRGCQGALAGSALGGAAAVLRLSLFPPPSVPNMDGLNQWGSHVGQVMLGLFLGGIIGVFYGANKRR